jgi:hypothetical protein
MNITIILGSLLRLGDYFKRKLDVLLSADIKKERLLFIWFQFKGLVSVVGPTGPNDWDWLFLTVPNVGTFFSCT